MKDKLINNYPNLPRIHGLVKTHKKDNPLGTIVDGTNGLIYLLSEFMNKSLNYLNNDNFDNKNTLELKNKLLDLNINTNTDKLYNYDVISLFSKTPLKLMYHLISVNWHKIEFYTSIKSKAIFCKD